MFTFADGTSLLASDKSTIFDVVFVVDNFDLVRDITDKFNEENLKTCQLGDVVYNDIAPVRYRAVSEPNGIVSLTIHNKQILTEQIVAQQIEDAKKEEQDKAAVVLEAAIAKAESEKDAIRSEYNELISKIGYHFVQNGNVIEVVKDETQVENDGTDYLKPISFEAGMTVKTGLWYTDGENIWEAISDGVPVDFNDTDYFDIIG